MSDALIALLPAADVTSVQDKSWQSATFSGIKSQITLQLRGENAAGRVDQFRTTLPETEFNLRRFIVADILVADVQENENEVTLMIEALLLDE